MRNGLAGITRAAKPKKGDRPRAAWAQWVTASIQRSASDPFAPPLLPPLEQMRWEISSGIPAKIYVGLGCVNYVQMHDHDPSMPGGEPPARFVRGIVPTIDGVRIDDEERPSFDVADKDNATVWLVVQAHRCYSADLPDEPERLMLTDRDDRPEIEQGEVAIEIASFDLDLVGDEEEGIKRISNLEYRLRSDWEQFYGCDGDTDPSNDSDWGSDEASGNSLGSLDSVDSDDDLPPPPGCKVKMTARWINKVSCFPAKPTYDGTKPCTPDGFTFEFEVTFTGTDPFDRPCPHWAYGVSMPGSASPEQVWLDSSTMRVKFTWVTAPACQSVVLTWRARGYGPLRNLDGSILESCCGSVYAGSITSSKLGPVCGCGCSSSGDLDGDGIENDADADVDGDGLGNGFDTDVDGDGILNDVDPDADGDGIPNETDPTPLGPI